jgi:hypothetical protein
LAEKTEKTRAELEALLMAELRKDPACSSIDAIAITGTVGRLWNVAVARDGPRIQPECRLKIWKLTEKLCSQYDLVPGT